MKIVENKPDLSALDEPLSRDMIASMLETDPENRPSVADLLR